MNVIAYLRVSTDGQAQDDKFGLDSQRSIIQNYCDAHDMVVSDWYVDKGQSGVKESRPQLDAILFGEVKNPPVEGVVVAKSDRVARDIKLYYYFMMLLEKKGMKLISATEELVNDDTGLGNVYKALMLFVAEQERMNITKRTSGGRTVKAKNGGYAGGRVPYGYKNEHGAMVVDPERAEVVRFIFEMREGGMTYKEIAIELNANGIHSSYGGSWYAPAVKVVLDNKKTYLGYYKYGDSDWVKGQHEPIL